MCASYAQNLVINPGFEDHDRCVAAHRVDFFKGNFSWTRLKPSTPDLFCTGGLSTDNGVPDNYQGSQTAHRGGAYSGLVTEFITDEGDVCREYSIGRLQTPLEKGSWYYLEFFYSLADKAGYSMNHLGMKLLTDVDNLDFSTCPAIGKAYYLAEADIESLESRLETKYWHKVSGTYQAHGGEKYVMLGCFAASDKTIINYRLLNGSSTKGRYSSYYYFDDIRVLRIGVKLPDTVYLCPGDSYELHARVDTSLHAQLSWNTGQSGDKLTVHSEGRYILSLDFDDVHIKDTTDVVLLPDKLELGADTFGCSDEPFFLRAPEHFDRYEWEDGSSSKTRLIAAKGTYALTVENACGLFSDEIEVDILDCSCQIYIPNVFTPNGDDQNEDFGPFVLCLNPTILSYEFSVFDRWGAKLFHTTEPSGRWTPKNALPGVYTYIMRMRIKRPDGEELDIMRAGDVVLMK